MRFKLVALTAILVALQASALTLAQTRTQVDAYIDTIEVNARNRIQECLATQESCQTAWSCPTPCNTTSAAGSLCTTAQVDTGSLDACGVATGLNTFSSRGITLPANAPVCFKLDVYSGPGGRGGALCYRAQHAGVIYEKCRGFGPQAAAFAHDWAVVQ